MSTAIYLNQFQPVLPPNRFSQTETVRWLTERHRHAQTHHSERPESPDTVELTQKLIQRYAIKSNQISTRYSECADVSVADPREGEIYGLTEVQPWGKNILERNLFFSQRALGVFEKLYPASDVGRKPNHLVHVTCTGYVSPSAAQRIVTERGWDAETAVTHAYHMGCYAALPSIRIAQGLVLQGAERDPLFSVDIVHTEMCGLHMNAHAHTPEQIIVQTLFADGHIRYSVSRLKSAGQKSLRLLAILERVLPDSEQDMSWIPAAWGMQMTLSRDVPLKIKAAIKPFCADLLVKAGVSAERAMAGVFAIHPGGPKIIDSVQETLELRDDQVAHSKRVLYERGNMSSATLPHVWNEILRSDDLGECRLVVSFAFGPGLTLFGAVFEVAE